MHAPISGHRDERGFQIALNLQSHAVHMQRYQRRRLAAAVDVGLVARNVRIVDDRRVGNGRVHHRRLRQVALLRRRPRPGRVGRRPRHRRRSRNRLLSVEYPLGDREAVLDAAGELAGHVAGGNFPAKVVICGLHGYGEREREGEEVLKRGELRF